MKAWKLEDVPELIRVGEALAVAAIELAARGGSHRGPCTNDTHPDQECLLHVRTFIRRQTAVADALVAWHALTK